MALLKCSKCPCCILHTACLIIIVSPLNLGMNLRFRHLSSIYAFRRIRYCDRKRNTSHKNYLIQKHINRSRHWNAQSSQNLLCILL